MITIKATNMYDIAKEAQEKNKAKFDAHLESVICDYASRGETSISFDNYDEMWKVLTEQQQTDITKELRDAGFFVGVRRYAEPLFISWKEKKQ
jgi:hypothetical protein